MKELVYLQDRASGKMVEASLVAPIDEQHLSDFENKWKPWLEEYIKNHPPMHREESAHWNWRRKIEKVKDLLAFESHAVECQGVTQGLMRINNTATCRLDSQRGLHLVYIDYLETAPWNRSRLNPGNGFGGVGSVLIAAAIRQSEQEEFKGRIGLHSLPQSDAWYRDKCGMVSLGKDTSFQGLTYFEMTPVEATRFIQGGAP